MGEKIRVLVVDDNPQSAEMLSTYLDKQDNMDVVGVCEDGVKCLDFLEANEVDVVMLDLIMPNLDGIGVLEKTVYQNLAKKPIFIAMSVIKNETMIQRACDLGAKYYLIKPFDLELVKKRIDELVNTKMQNNLSMPLRSTSYLMGQGNGTTSMDEKITSIFLMIGIPAHIKGYTFLREAIKLVLNDETIINKITKELYPSIALRYDTTASKVERAIRHSIEVAWSRGKIENINHVFGYQIYNKNDKPTNGEFIALMADRLTLGQIA